METLPQETNRESTVILRKPVSLRIPAQIAEQVEAYGAECGLSKTDAYVHFLQAGLNQLQAEASEGATRNALEKTEEAFAATQAKLDSLQDQLSEALGLLKGEEAGGSAEKLEESEVRRIVAETAATYPAIARALLFGSFARGDFSDTSDVDIRIELDPSATFNLRDLSRFCKTVEQQTGRSVDVVSAQEIKNPSLALAIERDGVLVYER